MARSRFKKRALDGVLLVDKPSGPSSNAILQRVKYLYQAEKAGHAGTLDPLASGALLICFGRATKLCRFLLNHDKRYRVEMQLGATTDTGDADGVITSEQAVHVTKEQVAGCVAKFRGEISQVPPMYSALKRDGQPLYRLARAGLEVEREARVVSIYENILHDFDTKLSRVTLAVHCSKGTYIRSLVEDIGRDLGCGAHVTQLRRTETGGFSGANLQRLSDLEDDYASGGLSLLDSALLPLFSMVADYPCLSLSMGDILTLRHGRVFTRLFPGYSGWCRVMMAVDVVLALVYVNPEGSIDKPLIWMHDPLLAKQASQQLTPVA
jgi:tRNA pseudouridine55 synthase